MLMSSSCRKVRSITDCSPRRPEGSSAGVRLFRRCSSYRRVPIPCALSALNTTDRKASRSRLCDGLVSSRGGSRLNAERDLDMASPRDIFELSKGVGRLSASLAELNRGTQGLAKVNIDKLESQHLPGNEERLGQEEEGFAEGGKAEEGRDIGKVHSSPARGRVDGNVSRLQDEEAENVARTAGKAEEEESALDEILGRIRSENAPWAEVEGRTGQDNESGKEDFGAIEVGKVGKVQSDGAAGKVEEDVGKAIGEKDLGKVTVGEVGKTEVDSGAGEGVPAMVGKADSQSAPSKLEDNVRRLHESFGPDGHPAIVGKTEGREFASTPGSFKELRQPEESEEGVPAMVGKTDSQSSRSKLEENVRRLQESFGPDGRPAIVGKTEGRAFASTTGGFKELGQPEGLQGGVAAKVGKTDGQSSRSKLEENVRRLHESFGPDGHPAIVGKTEGREFVSTPGSFIDIKKAGKLEDGSKSDVGRDESQIGSGKLQEDVGKVGKLTGNDEGMKPVNDGGAADAKTLENPRKNESDELSMQETEARGKASNVYETKVSSEEKAGESEGAGQTETSSSEKPEPEHGTCIIQFASKGPAEATYIDKLQSGDGLRLPDGAVVIVSADSANSVKEGFDVNLYLKYLPTSRFGRLVLYAPVLSSTHSVLSQNFHAFPVGTLCTAGAQSQGKGRAGNLWISPQGCLMFSFTVQMTNGHLVPFLQYVVSLAVIQAVEDNCKSSGLPAPDLRIKWPNDLYAKGLKIGGVLCTSSYRAKTFNIVVGVGLNVGNREPTTCLEALIDELGGQSTAIKQEELLAVIMSKFEALNSVFQDQGFLPLQNDYYKKWLHSGQSVVLEEKEQGTSSISHVGLTIQGLTPTGYLLATDDAGEKYELHPDGNSFDFLKGLVRQKLAS